MLTVPFPEGVGPAMWHYHLALPPSSVRSSVPEPLLTTLIDSDQRVIELLELPHTGTHTHTLPCFGVSSSLAHKIWITVVFIFPVATHCPLHILNNPYYSSLLHLISLLQYVLSVELLIC